MKRFLIDAALTIFFLALYVGLVIVIQFMPDDKANRGLGPNRE